MPKMISSEIINSYSFAHVIVLFSLLLIGRVASAQLMFYDSAVLANTKADLRNSSASKCQKKAFEMLLNNANATLAIDDPTVMDKSIDPPTGNKHDYLSISRYWWPDPSSPDGLPWIRKDGITNPDTQTDAVDRRRLATLTSGVKYLSLAYYFTDDERYAEKAASMIKTWFLNEDTRMNPHLEFAQSVPGNPNGRRSGILDGRSIALIIPDALHLIKGSSS